MTIEICKYTVSDFVEIDEDGEMTNELRNWSIGLWFDDWECSDIETIYLAWDDNDIVGFQTTNLSNETVAIEIKESHREQGLARMLLDESESFIPDRNENPSFWAWVKQTYL
jgi:GNAT superfamily N-acetyltransferase